MEAVSTVLGLAACCVSVCEASGNPSGLCERCRPIGEGLGGEPRAERRLRSPKPRPEVIRFKEMPE